MIKDKVTNVIIVATQAGLTALQVDEILKYVNLILTCLGTLLIIISTIVDLYNKHKGNKATFWGKIWELVKKLFTWGKKAGEDGKITSSEVSELGEEIQKDEEGKEDTSQDGTN